jgi:transketolase
MAAVAELLPDNPVIATQADILTRQPAPAQRMANAIRILAIDATEHAQSGHPGMPMGMADVATALWTRFHKFDAADPRWSDRDRLVLSAGHGSLLLYVLIHLTGHDGMSIDDLRNFRQLHSPAAGHPEYGEHPAIETTTGPLGQGLATAVGMAIAERNMAARFGKSLVDHRTWVIASDGDMMEGISHEAAALAGHLGLSKLTVMYDDNHVSIDGDTALSYSDDILRRFAAYGWATKRVDGHDPAQINAARALEEADHDRLQHNHRLRCADQGRQRRSAWRAAGTVGGGRCQAASGLVRTTLRHTRRSEGTLARRRRPGRIGPPLLAQAPRAA